MTISENFPRVHTCYRLTEFRGTIFLQLLVSWLSMCLSYTNMSRQKLICQRTRRAMYNNSKTTVEKISGRIIQIFWVLFSVIIFWLIIFKTSKNMIPTKRNLADLELLCRILICRCLGTFWGASDQWQINFLVSQGSWADLCALDNIVHARTSDNLVRAIFFQKKYSTH